MKILQHQRLIQERFAAERGMQNPVKIETRGQFVDYIREMREFLIMELDELLDEVDSEKICRKPWKEQHTRHRDFEFAEWCDENVLQQEAVDALCFMMNICLACGVTEDNVEELYNQVHAKNIERLNNDY